MTARAYPDELQNHHAVPDLQTYDSNPYAARYTQVVQKSYAKILPNKTQRTISGRTDVALLNGKFDEGSIAELEQSICDATSAQQRVLLDLSEVTLVDRKTVQFFSERASQGVKLVNCPIYLRRWIAQVSDEI